MREIIAIANQKGGVGKTTTSINLASSLVKKGKKVLVIDFDPQGNCSLGLGIDIAIPKKIINHAIINPACIETCIIKTPYGLDIIPSNINLATLEKTIQKTDPDNKNIVLRNLLNEPSLQKYDFVIIDCPPSLGFLSINALNAASSVIIPVQCEYFALDAVAQILSVIVRIQHNSNKNLDILGILLTMYDYRTTLSTEISQQIISLFKEKVFKSQIPRNIYIPEGCAKGQPVNIYKPKAQGSLAYNQLAEEIIKNVEEKHNSR